MTISNKLSILRIILVPAFLVFLLEPKIPCNYIIAAVLFIIAAITDLLDGYLARKLNQITDFGKFLDPLADKILVTAALAGFIQMGFCNTWVLVVVLFREFAVTSVRLTAASKGKVVAANMWGKVKTASQLVIIPFILVFKQLNGFGFIPASFHIELIFDILLWFIAFVTLMSGVVYIWQNREFINTIK